MGGPENKRNLEISVSRAQRTWDRKGVMKKLRFELLICKGLKGNPRRRGKKD